jgi:hypothetical protein
MTDMSEVERRTKEKKDRDRMYVGKKKDPHTDMSEVERRTNERNARGKVFYEPKQTTMSATKLKVCKFYLSGARNPTKTINNTSYVGYRFYVDKTVAKSEVVSLKKEGYVAHTTDPVCTTPQGDPVYIVWIKRKDYATMMKKIKTHMFPG